jgi:hypothetical protein
MVGVPIFAAGGVMSLYQGVVHMRAPNDPVGLRFNLVVIAICAVFELSSFAVSRSGMSRPRRL